MGKKILYLENGIGWGGAAICLKLIASHLNRDRFIPVIVSSHKDGEYQEYKKIAEWYWVPFRKPDRSRGHALKRLASLSDYLLCLMPNVFRLLNLSRRIRPDIIHLNNEPVCNMAGVLVAKCLRIPCISHVRGPVECDSPLTRWLYHQVDYLLCVSKWIKEGVLQLGIAPDKVETLVDGRDLEEFKREYDIESLRRELGLKEKELAIGMVGRLNPWKGHKTFIKAVALVEQELPDCKFFVIGGSAEVFQDYERELKEYVDSLNLKRLVFTGQRPDIVKVMKSLDIIIHASEKPDPYPNVVLEAMACGRPVIASNIGGPPEMIEHGETGLLIPPANPIILAKSIKDLIQDRDLRESLGRRAKEVAFDRYDIKAHVGRLEDIYNRFLRNR